MLRQAITAELAQTVKPREIVVVDNGGLSETRMVVASFGDAVVYIDAPGVSRDASRNLGIQQAASAWISLLDDDDYHLPGFLASASEVMADGRANVIVTDQQPFDEKGPRKLTGFANMPPRYWDQVGKQSEPWSFVDKFPVERMLLRNPYEPGQMLVRKDLLVSVGAFDVTFPYSIGEIFDLNLRLLSAGRLAIVWAPLLMYRRHAGNTTSNFFVMDFHKLRTFEFIQEHRAFLSNAFMQALPTDLPARRLSLISRSFEAGEFVKMRALISAIAPGDRTLKMRAMELVAALPEPLLKNVSWFVPKVIRHTFRPFRRRT